MTALDEEGIRRIGGGSLESLLNNIAIVSRLGFPGGVCAPGVLFLCGGIHGGRSYVLRWSASSCYLSVGIVDGWWLQAPALKNKDLQPLLRHTGMFYQLGLKSGWSSIPTSFGGSVPLQGELSSGKLGFLSVFEASDSLLLGDAVVGGHLLWPGRSTSIVHVRFDMLLKTATKNYVSSPQRMSASSSALQLPAARKTGRALQGLECNFLLFRARPCKKCAVITKIYE